MVYEIQKQMDLLSDVLVPKSAQREKEKASGKDDEFKEQKDAFNDTYLVWEPETLK